MYTDVMHVDRKRFLITVNLAFVDYVEAYESTDNTSAARSAACIALYPNCNSTGSWTLWKLDTNCNVQRTKFVKLVTTNTIIDRVNGIGEDELKGCEVVMQPDEMSEIKETNPETSKEITETQSTGSNAVLTGTSETNDNIGEQDAVRTSSGRIVKKPGRFLGVIQFSDQDVKAAETRKAITAELKQLFEELHALTPIFKDKIPQASKVLNSHMFVGGKYLACGKFDKMKARLVADGRDQDPEMFPNKSSPTVPIQSILVFLGIIVTWNWRNIIKTDIKGAYVQTSMSGDPVYIRINPKITKQIVQLFPKYGKFVDDRGYMYTVMKKAMYGCIQASAMWFNLLTKVLREFGYEHCPTDRCVMRKVKRNKIFFLLIYVDDILAIVDNKENWT
jgi:Reverse transcriptase (RNA-dependent DNA polymerase)